jgi:hypothetical protein
MSTNGATDGLSLLFQDGKTYLGAPSASEGAPLYLEPVYELQVMVQQVAQGQHAIGHGCAPPLMLPSLKRLPVTGTLLPLSDLSAHDQKTLRTAYEQGGKLANDLRLGQLGIQPATAIPKIQQKRG